MLKYFFWSFCFMFIVITGLMGWLSYADFSTAELPSIFFIASGLSSFLMAIASGIIALACTRAKGQSDA